MIAKVSQSGVRHAGYRSEEEWRFEWHVHRARVDGDGERRREVLQQARWRYIVRQIYNFR